VNYVACNGDAICALARQFLTLAQKQGGSVPLMLGHRLEGTSLLYIGELTQARAHLDRAIELYDPEAHRPLATRFAQDARMASLLRRSMALWFLGYPDAALADSQNSVSDARQIGHAATLLFALWGGFWIQQIRGNYPAASVFAEELASLAEEKGALYWKPCGMIARGFLFAATGKPADAIATITGALAAYRSTGARLGIPEDLAYLAKAHSELGQNVDSLRCIGEAMTAVETTKEKWHEAEIHRIAGEITLMSPEPDAAKAEAYFERALAVARAQQAKSWELRAAMSMARVWREQGKREEARELLAPVYGWFTEGFDTLDLKQAKALLDELAA
jgi:predicted ATPase